MKSFLLTALFLGAIYGISAEINGTSSSSEFTLFLTPKPPRSKTTVFSPTVKPTPTSTTTVKTTTTNPCKSAVIRGDFLPFGGVERRLPREYNLTWGADIVEPTGCSSEFVVSYRTISKDPKKSPGITNIVCPSFKIDFNSTASEYSCLLSFSEAECDSEVTLILETWLKGGKLLQPEVNIKVDCSEGYLVTELEKKKEKKEETTDEEAASASSLLPLVLNPSKNLCLWSEWGEWSKCPITCGFSPGRRIRTRSQRGSRFCGKSENDFKECHVNKCAQNCVLDHWAEWTECSQSCGTGLKSRFRSIGIPALYGGRPCPSSEPREETAPCLENECAVDGLWSHWTLWGYCDKPCGQGSRVRTRECDAPVPEFGGKECEGGLTFEEEGCLVKKCDPVDGGWSQWTRWTKCSKFCGPGHTARSRDCNKPTPMHQGKDCFGEGYMSRKCYLRKCSDVNSTTTTTTTTERPIVRSRVPETTEKKKDPPITIEPVKVHPWTTIPNLKTTEDESNFCYEPAPFIKGMIGPFQTATDVNEAQFKLQLGQKAFYKCPNGRVLNSDSNTGLTWVTCDKETRKIILPENGCVVPTHCVGVEHFKGLAAVLPARDGPVNTKVIGICRSDDTVTGSCFPDGKVHFPSSCNGETKEVIESCTSEKAATEIILDEESMPYAWINVSPMYQTEGGSAFSGILSAVNSALNGGQSHNFRPNQGLDGNLKCLYDVKAPLGKRILIGVESPEQNLQFVLTDNVWKTEEKYVMNEETNSEGFIIESQSHDVRISLRGKSMRINLTIL